jgi:iron complex transport system substrate-binding protein
MKTFSPSAMPVFALKTAGGINVASEANSVRGTNIAYFGKERILSLADQIDIYLAQQGAMNNSTEEMIRNEPGFSVIKAVREGKIYMVDEKLVSRPTMRLLSGMVKIGEILYPDIFNDDAKNRVCDGLK